ncbi:MAG: hypothetical protein PHT03_00865 [Bacilli bacterium]|nr:hypothetical protein [Bacilli bacterium]MDD4387733.1 hypothetical protein [Bacilli bacterium]
MIYHVVNNHLYELYCQVETVALLQGQLPIQVTDSYFGVCFDYFIGLLFNVNIRDVKTYFHIFGG